jgi:hypothetical protein
MATRAWLLMAAAAALVAGCVALPEESGRPGAAASPSAPPGTTPQATVVPPTTAPTTAAQPSPLGTSTPGATTATTPPATAAGTRPPRVRYGHADDYSWLAGQYIQEGQCHMVIYDLAGADPYGGRTFVAFSGSTVPRSGQFVTVYGNFIPSDRALYPNCPESTYLVTKTEIVGP